VKTISKTLRASLDVSPGISFYGKPEDQTLGNLHVMGRTFSALSPIVRYELLRDIVLLTHGMGSATE
jgi:hypothetical protein